MERFTISLDEQAAHDFDYRIAERGDINRSEAVRDIRIGRPPGSGTPDNQRKTP